MTIEKREPTDPEEGPRTRDDKIRKEEVSGLTDYFNQIFPHWILNDPRRAEALRVFEGITSSVERDAAAARWLAMRQLVGKLEAQEIDTTTFCDCLFRPLLHASLAISFVDDRVSVQLLQLGQGRVTDEQLVHARGSFGQCGFTERDLVQIPGGETMYSFERHFEPREIE